MVAKAELLNLLNVEGLDEAGSVAESMRMFKRESINRHGSVKTPSFVGGKGTVELSRDVLALDRTLL